MTDKGVGGNLREWGPLFTCAALAFVAFYALVLHSHSLSSAAMLGLALVCLLAWGPSSLRTGVGQVGACLYRRCGAGCCLGNVAGLGRELASPPGGLSRNPDQ